MARFNHGYLVGILFLSSCLLPSIANAENFCLYGWKQTPKDESAFFCLSDSFSPDGDCSHPPDPSQVVWLNQYDTDQSCKSQQEAVAKAGFCSYGEACISALVNSEKCIGQSRYPTLSDCVNKADTLTLEEKRYTDIVKDLKPPQPSIRIPGIQFSDVQRTLDADGNISVPWIGEYISGIYKFAMGLGSIVAVILIIQQGITIVISGGGEMKTEAYQKIGKIFLGLGILWGSYAILYTINPELVNFKILKIKFIEPAELPTLGTTTVATGDTESAGGPIPGSHKPITTSCPLALTSTVGKNSKIEFREKMKTALTATNQRDRIVQIADIADACNVNWGSCGNTAGTITALGGGGDTGCIDSDKGNCNDGGKGKKIFGVSNTQRNFLFGWRCGVNKEYPGKAKPFGQCVDSAKEAVAKVRTYLFSEKAAGQLPADWPDGWANKLRPGDRVVIYNGNEDLVGSHAVIFTGWAGDKMQVVQGGGGGSGEEKDRARSGTWCVKSSCEDNLIPLISGFSAD